MNVQHYTKVGSNERNKGGFSIYKKLDNFSLFYPDLKRQQKLFHNYFNLLHYIRIHILSLFAIILYYQEHFREE